MRHVTLDGLKMIDKYTTHEYMHQKLMLPEYYGHNLDALYDVLNAHNKEMTITLINEAKLIEYLGEYGQKLVRTFKDIERSNPSINFKVI